MYGGAKLTVEERFWKLIEKTDTCWLWKGRIRATALTGSFCLDKRAKTFVLPHRYSYELHIGSLSEDDIVDHTCENIPCVNPAHLQLRPKPVPVPVLSEEERFWSKVY